MSLGDMSKLQGAAGKLKAVGGEDKVSPGAGVPISLPIAKVKSRVQSRKRFRHIEELATTIEKHGLNQPIVVYKDGSNYVIINGERRWRAFKLLKRKDIPAVLKERSDGLALTSSELIENIQRDDLTPMELASALQPYRADGMNQEEIAAELGRSQKWVSIHLSLFNVDERIQELYEAELVSDAETLNELRKLLEIAPGSFEILSKKAAETGLTRSEAKQAVADAKSSAGKGRAGKGSKAGSSTPPAWFGDVSSMLKAYNSDSNRDVKARFDSKEGTGLLQIPFNMDSVDEFESAVNELVDELKKIKSSAG